MTDAPVGADHLLLLATSVLKDANRTSRQPELSVQVIFECRLIMIRGWFVRVISFDCIGGWWGYSLSELYDFET